MFVAFDPAVRVSIGVVALGAHERLARCLEAICEHESSQDFTVVAVVNAVAFEGTPGHVPAPSGVRVEAVQVNLGWSGGLHRARDCTDAELLVWVQDDMVPEPGWLDALVAAAEAHPRVGGFGSVRVDAEGRGSLPNAGSATPPHAVELWTGAVETVIDDLPDDVTTYDWVASTGFLTRARAWDELGGTDPRFWPVHHGDKDYCTHLRCHGWDVALVPDARVRHEGGQSAPSPLRDFIAVWREPWFNRRWSTAVAELVGRSSGVVAHPCADWSHISATQVEVVTGAEASRMLVPLGRALAEQSREDLEALADRLSEVEQALADRLSEVEQALAGLSEVEQALVRATAERDDARRRVQRLRRRLRAAQRVRPPARRSWLTRLRRPLP